MENRQLERRKESERLDSVGSICNSSNSNSNALYVVFVKWASSIMFKEEYSGKKVKKYKVKELLNEVSKNCTNTKCSECEIENWCKPENRSIIIKWSSENLKEDL